MPIEIFNCNFISIIDIAALQNDGTTHLSVSVGNYQQSVFQSRDMICSDATSMQYISSTTICKTILIGRYVTLKVNTINNIKDFSKINLCDIEVFGKGRYA